MTIIAVIGDCTTTTCVALAANWSSDDSVIVFEADPSGGSLSGWLDTPAAPTLGTIVANARATPESPLDVVTAMTHSSASGIRFVAAPVRGLAARRAIDEASATIVPALAATCDLTVITDLGRVNASDAGPLLSGASAAVIVHRQRNASAAAESVRVERLVESIENHAGLGTRAVLAIVGAAPFDPPEIRRFIEDSIPGALAGSILLADDPLAAAVIAGRTGVSASRLRRLPLMRTARTAASGLRADLLAGTPPTPADRVTTR